MINSFSCTHLGFALEFRNTLQIFDAVVTGLTTDDVKTTNGKQLHVDTASDNQGQTEISDSVQMSDFLIWCARLNIYQQLDKAYDSNLYYSKKVLHHQFFTKFYMYHFFLSIPKLNFNFDTALEDSIQYRTQQ